MNSRRINAAVLSAVAALTTGTSAALATLPAFPGADGFGEYALGGRGGAVYHVTNLTDNTSTPAAGSFRAVLAQIESDEKKGTVTAATVVFDVGGTIQLTSNLDIKNVNNVTIAGQTAPGPGISMVGYKFDVTSSNGTKADDPTTNIVVRYIADRRGNTISSANDDAMGVLGSTSDTNHNTNNIIFDHVTASWGMDEDLSVTDSATNVTIQNSIISEALESGHQFGSLIRPRYGASVSYIGNLYANNQSRNPRPGSYNNSLLNFDFRNNTVYNWGDRAGYTGGATDNNTEFVDMNYTGNYLIAGPSTPTDFHQTTAFLVDTSQGVKDPLNIQVYQANNLVDTNRNGTPDGSDIGWNAFLQYNGTVTSSFTANQSSILTTVEESSPFAYPVASSTTTDPTIANQITLASAGAMPWNRNESDARVVNDVLTNQGAILQTAPTNEYNDLINQAQVTRPAGFDSDGDGMPDSWETARGLNPNLASDGNVVVTSAESSTMAGYTWLEVYLNDLTLQATWAGGASASWDGIMNWRGQLPNLQDSTANFGNVGGAGQISVGSNEHVGQLVFANPSGFTLNGPGAISLDVLAHVVGGVTTGYATVNVTTGNVTVGVPMNMLSDTHFTIAGGSQLAVTGNFNAAGHAVTKDGGGNLNVNNIVAGTVSVSSGALVITGAGSLGTGSLTSLKISGSGVVDIGSSALVIPYSGTSPIGELTPNGHTQTYPANSIQGYIQSASDGGVWDNPGLTSSKAENDPFGATGVGALDQQDLLNLEGSDYTGSTWMGVSITSDNTVLVRYTYYGDTDLDGTVGPQDVNNLELGYAGLGNGWVYGDFNYDGVVDGQDVNLLDLNYADVPLGDIGLLTQAQAQWLLANEKGLTPQQLAAFEERVGVPEPTSIALAAIGSVGLLSRRRRQIGR